MNREEIITITRKFLSEEFEVDPSTIEGENNLKTTLDLDSLDYVDLVVVIEENFGFKTNADDFQKVITFNDFYDMVERKLSKIV
ncbi:MAG: acyl carrier protein [Flavobacteriia bacterium]|nr:acyl carrier protein [Flavobacteriia bacterium]